MGFSTTDSSLTSSIIRPFFYCKRTCRLHCTDSCKYVQCKLRQNVSGSYVCATCLGGADCCTRAVGDSAASAAGMMRYVDVAPRGVIVQLPTEEISQDVKTAYIHKFTYVHKLRVPKPRLPSVDFTELTQLYYIVYIYKINCNNDASKDQKIRHDTE